LGATISELTPEVIGRRLGQNLYNQAGNLLLRKGVELNERFYNFFVEQGYRSIFLLSPNPEEGLHVNSDKLLATAPFVLKRIFRRMRQDDNVRAAQAKGELISLAESIFVHVRNTLQKPPQIVELKRQSDYLYQHSVNVTVFSIYVGQKMGFSEQKLLHLAVASLLHDFGMEFVDNEVVNKTSRLEEKEYEHIKEHTTKGFSHLVRNCSFDGLTTVASVQHHERHDGLGYPKSLGGNDIHEFSRIVSLTDTFDAWTSDRPHRRLNSIENAVEFVRSNENKLFDPLVVNRFVEVFS